ncbi:MULTISPECIES: hypothetical protein [unclassified Brenneria]|nr:hypothetical protein [Brenneria sp. L3-3C-1]MEE3643023.1 hypothetical protein [Brenneria sp. L3_3C_1]
MPFYLITFLLNGVAGIYLVSTFEQQGGVSEISVVVAILNLLGLWGLLFVWITQTRINTANYYLATVNMQVFFDRLFRLRGRKIVWACIVGAVVYVLMLADIFSYILQALAYQGVFVVAWVGVALGHIFSDAPTVERHTEQTFSLRGLSAWFLSVSAGIALMHGSAALQSFSAPTTFAIALLLYRFWPRRQTAHV